jgi:hypothetical protein
LPYEEENPALIEQEGMDESCRRSENGGGTKSLPQPGTETDTPIVKPIA